MKRTIVIADRSAFWRRWLLSALAAPDGVEVLVLDSVSAVLAALRLHKVELLIVELRLGEPDGCGGFAWISALRHAVGPAPARVVATISGLDRTGDSLARLAGADLAYRKGQDKVPLRQALSAWAVQVARPWPGMQAPMASWHEALPVFEPLSIGLPGRALAEQSRRVAFEFLSMLKENLQILQRVCVTQDRWASLALSEFARECRASGALRAGGHAEWMAAELAAGQALDPESVLGYFRLLVDTSRAMGLWLLELDRAKP